MLGNTEKLCLLRASLSYQSLSTSFEVNHSPGYTMADFSEGRQRLAVPPPGPASHRSLPSLFTGSDFRKEPNVPGIGELAKRDTNRYLVN